MERGEGRKGIEESRVKQVIKKEGPEPSRDGKRKGNQERIVNKQGERRAMGDAIRSSASGLFIVTYSDQPQPAFQAYSNTSSALESDHHLVQYGTWYSSILISTDRPATPPVNINFNQPVHSSTAQAPSAGDMPSRSVPGPFRSLSSRHTSLRISLGAPTLVSTLHSNVPGSSVTSSVDLAGRWQHFNTTG